MGYIISIGFSLLILFSGCTSYQKQEMVQALRKVELDERKTASQEITLFKSMPQHRRFSKSSLQKYKNHTLKQKKIPALAKKRITFSAEDAKLSQVLHVIVKESGLNLIIDKDVDTNTPLTISFTDAKAQDVLDIIMTMSGCHYTVQGNILHIKHFMQKMFVIPYIHSKTSFNSKLGGDILNSAQSNGDNNQGIKGGFDLLYNTPKKKGSFYDQLEENIKALMSSDGHYTLNRLSGVLSVYDKKNNVDTIESMVNKIKKYTQRQVLIEAKILEVILNDDHSMGVNWNSVAKSLIRGGDQLLLQQTLGLEGAVTGTVNYTSNNFNAIITALNQSGDIDILSNPRIKVLNGQSALISSGKLVPFWEKEVQITQGTGGSASTKEVTYNRRDILNGLTMGVTPVIMDDGRIMLNVIPITSNIEKIVEHFDETGQSVATAPILNIKEAGTVIYASNNDLVTIGGLVNNTVTKNQEKLPFLGNIPLIGQLFTKNIDKKEKRELIILMKLTIIE